jgi:ferredoxin-NADP reductase
VHGTQNGRTHAFADHVRALQARHPGFWTHVVYSQPAASDRLGSSHDGEGFVSVDVLKQVLPFGQHDFYLCGPPPFMRSLHDGLLGLGVPKEQIRFESFGPASVPKAEPKPAARPDGPAQPAAAPAPRILSDPLAAGTVRVRFARSGLEDDWTPSRGTLLEMAESLGIAPPFACRSGICGTCTTRLSSGGVHYVEEPIAARQPGEVLLCCSTPRDGDDGGEPGIVLEL